MPEHLCIQCGLPCDCGNTSIDCEYCFQCNEDNYDDEDDEIEDEDEENE